MRNGFERDGGGEGGALLARLQPQPRPSQTGKPASNASPAWDVDLSEQGSLAGVAKALPAPSPAQRSEVGCAWLGCSQGPRAGSREFPLGHNVPLEADGGGSQRAWDGKEGEGGRSLIAHPRRPRRSEQAEAHQLRWVGAQACGENCRLCTFPGPEPQPCGQRFSY